jgi:hypothetical protein
LIREIDKKDILRKNKKNIQKNMLKKSLLTKTKPTITANSEISES